MSDKPSAHTHAPLYANLYPSMVTLARAHGYALAVHGSMVRDLDLIAVPWIEHPSSAIELVTAFSTQFYFVGIDGPSAGLHGREIWTLAFPGTCFVDLSIMPITPYGNITINNDHAR